MSAHTAKRPQPVLTRSSLVTVVAVLAALLLKVGAGDVSVWLDAHADVLAGALLAAGPTITAILARMHVTPLSAPRDADGARLVKESTHPVSTSVLDVLAEAESIHPSS